MRPSTRKSSSAALQLEVVDDPLPATSGEEQRFLTLYEQACEQMVRRTPLDFPRDRMWDALQSTALQLWQMRKRLTPEQQSVGYFVRAMERDLVDAMRSWQRDNELVVSLSDRKALEVSYPDLTTPSPLRVAEQASEYAYARRYAATLRGRRHDVWNLCIEQGKTPKEAGETLELSQITVRRHLARISEHFAAEEARSNKRLARNRLRALPTPRPEVTHD